MTVGRTSTLSAALTRTIACILLAGLLLGVKAECESDDTDCKGSAIFARIGIAIGAFLLFALILSLVTYRRRRAAQANLVYVQEQQSDGNANRHSWLADAPQLPLQAYGAPPPYTGFAPPAGSMPQ